MSSPDLVKMGTIYWMAEEGFIAWEENFYDEDRVLRIDLLQDLKAKIEEMLNVCGLKISSQTGV